MRGCFSAIVVIFLLASGCGEGSPRPDSNLPGVAGHHLSRIHILDDFLESRPLGRPYRQCLRDLSGAAERKGLVVYPGIAIQEAAEPGAIDIIHPLRIVDLHRDRAAMFLPRWRMVRRGQWLPVNDTARAVCDGRLVRVTEQGGMDGVLAAAWNVAHTTKLPP